MSRESTSKARRRQLKWCNRRGHTNGMPPSSCSARTGRHSAGMSSQGEKLVEFCDP